NLADQEHARSIITNPFAWVVRRSLACLGRLPSSNTEIHFEGAHLDSTNQGPPLARTIERTPRPFRRGEGENRSSFLRTGTPSGTPSTPRNPNVYRPWDNGTPIYPPFTPCAWMPAPRSRALLKIATTCLAFSVASVFCSKFVPNQC